MQQHATFVTFNSFYRKHPFLKRHKTILIIALELIGILLCVFYLREPLYQKFLAEKPKAYSATEMNPNSRYLVRLGDILVGKSLPETEVKMLLLPQRLKSKTTTNKNGLWGYKIPLNLPAGKYRLAVATNNQNTNIKTFKMYKLHLKTPSFRSLLRKPVFTTYAQDEQLDESYTSELVTIPEEVVSPIIDTSELDALHSPAPNLGSIALPDNEGDQSLMLRKLRTCSEQEVVAIGCDPNKWGYTIKKCGDEFYAEYDTTGVCSDPNFNNSTTRRTVGPDVPISYCPSFREIEENRENRNSCKYLHPEIDIFGTAFPDYRKQQFLSLYHERFVGKKIDTGNIGTEEEFNRRVDYIISRSQQRGLNPAIFLSYWLAESGLSTARDSKGNPVSDFGCGGAKGSFSFEQELHCALGLKTNGEIPAENVNFGSVGPRCALSGDADSIPCRRILEIRNTTSNKQVYKNYPLTLPITTFDDLFEVHGSISTELSKIEGGVNNNCTNSYNTSLQLFLEIKQCVER